MEPRFSAETLRQVQQKLTVREQVAEYRMAVYRGREDCNLAVANALYRLHDEFDLTWEMLASALDGVSDKGHVHRLANRKVGVSRGSYRLLTLSINGILRSRGQEIVDFPIFPV